MPAWARSAAAVAVGLTPGLLALSAGAPGRFLVRLVPPRGKVRQKPSAEPTAYSLSARAFSSP
jgi:hypothetical protein